MSNFLSGLWFLHNTKGDLLALMYLCSGGFFGCSDSVDIDLQIRTSFGPVKFGRLFCDGAWGGWCWIIS